jgi:hypothetical protein
MAAPNDFNNQEETSDMKRNMIFILCAVAALLLLPEAGFAASNCTDIATSAGQVPADLAAACSSDAAESKPHFNPTDMAVSPDGVLEQCSSMILNNPGAPADFGSVPFHPACDFAGSDFSALYCYTIDVPGVLSSVSTADCSQTVIGTANNTQGASGMAWDDSTGTMYLSTTDIVTSELHVVDLGTGATTLVGGMGAASPANIAIGAVGGQLYGFDVVNDSLQSIDKNTGTATTIGPLGFDANFAQGMDFDESDGTCYIFAFNAAAFAAELRTCDVNTGATALVGTIGDGITLREWTGPGIMTSPPSDALFCFSLDNFCDTIEITSVLPDRSVVARWDGFCNGSPVPALGGYSGKNVSPRLSWIAGDLNANQDVFSFNFNVDNKTWDLFLHDTGGTLTQFWDDQPYSVSPGACPVSPVKPGRPSATDR